MSLEPATVCVNELRRRHRDTRAKPQTHLLSKPEKRRLINMYKHWRLCALRDDRNRTFLGPVVRDLKLNVQIELGPEKT